MAKVLMVQGTMSNVGKSLARRYTRRPFVVAHSVVISILPIP